MFTQKIPRQPTVSTSAPPTSGPRAMLMPTTPPQTPIARARSAGLVKVFVMMDMATGLSIEPPTACIIRNSTSQPSPGARLQSSEPSVNVARPVWKVRRRPTRSAVEPDSIRRLASTRVYASTVHCRPETDACRSCWMDGSATLTIVLSRPTMSRLMQQIARISALRRLLSSRPAIPAAGPAIPAVSATPAVCLRSFAGRKLTFCGRAGRRPAGRPVPPAPLP